MALIYFPVFGHLDSLPIRIWDEARLATNAIEMLRDGDFLVTHFEGKPDMWNTKPPLLIWFQVASLKWLCISELAIRLPSAIAVLLTCILLFVFVKHYFNNFWAGFGAVLVLITSHGYISLHGARTGDYDALLTFFVTLSALSFFSFLENQKKAFLYLFFFATLMACLTKGIAGLLILPGILLFTLVENKVRLVLRNPHFYLGIFFYLFVLLGFYVLAESRNPGYIQAVFDNDITGRFFEVSDHHNQNFWFYYHNILNTRFQFWYLFLPLGILIGFFHKSQIFNRITKFCFLIAISFLLIISSAKTKLDWYDLPIYPFLSILVSMVLYYGFNFLSKLDTKRLELSFNFIPYLFLFFCIIGPFRSILSTVFLPKEEPVEYTTYSISYSLRDILNHHQSHEHVCVVEDGYTAHIWFYLQMLAAKGIKIPMKTLVELKPGDLVLVQKEHIINVISQKFVTEKVLKSEGNQSDFTRIIDYRN